MKFLHSLLCASLAFVASTATHAQTCAKDELKFSFNKIDLRTAFAILADQKGYKVSLDPSISGAYPVNFPCTPWNEAVKNLADQHKLKYRVENQILYVTRK